MPSAGCEPSWQLISRSDGSGLSLGDVERRYSGTPRYLSDSRSKRRRILRAVASAEVISLSNMRQSGCGIGAMLYCAINLTCRGPTQR